MTSLESTSAARSPSRTGRSRDAAASRQALLRAAQYLFGRKGFERTTVREIGERSGVDAALIARYFGSKADLYIAAVAAERMGEPQPLPYEGLEQMTEALIARTDRHGPGPILQALVRSDTADEIRAAAQARVERRLVDPLVAGMADDEVDRPRLRAELAVSALLGVTLGRSLGWFEELGTVSRGELVALVVEALGAVAGHDPGPGDRPGGR
jgi:AcrR family transcriptional regulator